MKSIICAVWLYAVSLPVLADIVIIQTPDGGQVGCIVLKGFISCQWRGIRYIRCISKSIQNI